MMKWNRLVGLVGVVVALASCGKKANFAATDIEGTWKYSHISEGRGYGPSGFRIQNGTFEVKLTSGSYGCAAKYTLSGAHLDVEQVTTGGCRQAATDFDVEMPSKDEMVLIKDGVKFHYTRIDAATNTSSPRYGNYQR